MFSFSIKSGIDKSRIYRATISMNLPTSRGTSTISDLLNVI